MGFRGSQGAPSVEADTRAALVIGNSAYQSRLSLRDPVNDTRPMGEALSALGFRVIRLENATKAQIEAGLSELSRQLSPQAISLIYYAGHGACGLVS